jgi:hypothetical protein
MTWECMMIAAMLTGRDPNEMWIPSAKGRGE